MVKRSTSEKLFAYNLGFIDYKEAWDLQKELLELRVKDEAGDMLLLLEHPNTYTLGKTANKSNLISSVDFLENNKITVYDIDRGGDITYHGPGQIVGYPIIKLTNWEQDTHKYLRALEETIIRVCADYGLEAGRNSEYTGVWLADRKIAAIGIKVTRWVTMHGFAFNINTNLDLFTGIIPCGIQQKEVTSLQKEIGRELNISDVKQQLLKHFLDVFDYAEHDYLTGDKLSQITASN